MGQRLVKCLEREREQREMKGPCFVPGLRCFKRRPWGGGGSGTPKWGLSLWMLERYHTYIIVLCSCVPMDGHRLSFCLGEKLNQMHTHSSHNVCGLCTFIVPAGAWADKHKQTNEMIFIIIIIIFYWWYIKSGTDLLSFFVFLFLFKWGQIRRGGSSPQKVTFVDLLYACDHLLVLLLARLIWMTDIKLPAKRPNRNKQNKNNDDNNNKKKKNQTQQKMNDDNEKGGEKISNLNLQNAMLRAAYLMKRGSFSFSRGSIGLCSL